MKELNFRDFILQYGLVVGLIFGIITLVSYFMGIEFMVSWWLIGLNLIFIVGVPIYCGVQWKMMNGGILDFKNAFLTIFMIFAVSTFIDTLFNITLFTVIDPELPNNIHDAVLEKTVTMMENFGAQEDKIDEVIEEMENKREDYSVSSMLYGYFYYLFFGAVIALIGGAIIKKDKPVFDE